MDESKIFFPFRVIGYVCQNVPLNIKFNPRLKRYDIVTAISKTLNLYKYKGLRLVATSKPLSSFISHVTCNDTYLFASSNNLLFALNLNRDEIYKFVGHISKITHILPFGMHLISIDDTSRVIVWEIHTQDMYTEILFDPNTFKLSSICHPHTYLNKILLGSTQGNFKLWNIKSNREIYNFKGWNSPVTIIEQTPAIDIVGIGLGNGKIMIHNLKLDESLMEFKQEWGAVELLSFRTDGSTLFVSGSCKTPDLAVWDLNASIQTDCIMEEEECPNGNVVAVMKDMHASGPDCQMLSAKFIPFTPLLVSCSKDNSLKIWNFDRPDGTANLLHSREGHKSSLCKIRFFASNSTMIDMIGSEENTEYLLTSGADGSFMKFSTVHDGRNKSFGLRCKSGSKFKPSKVANLKTFSPSDLLRYPNLLPSIIDFDSKSIRQKEWDDTVCVHRNFPFATTWSSHRNTIGKHVLRFDPSYYEKLHNTNKSTIKRQTTKNMDIFSSTSPATRCFMTECGNFALIGYENGRIDKFNMQSGIFRGSYIFDDSELQPFNMVTQQTGPVCLLYTDSFNKILVSGYINNPTTFLGDEPAKVELFVWAFKSRKLCNVIKIGPHLDARLNSKGQCLMTGSLLTKVNAYHETNGLLALALKTNSIVMVDVTTRKLVRYFPEAHDDRITDLGFRKHDCQWLYSSSMDGTFKTWHIPSGCLIDILHTSNPCYSSNSPIISFDTSTQYLATAHLNDQGVYLWSDVTPFRYVDLNPIDQKRHNGQLHEGEEIRMDKNLDASRNVYEESRKDLITLSNLPLHYSKTVLNLEALKIRNKAGSNNLLFDWLNPETNKTNNAHLPFFLGKLTNQENKFGLDQIVPNTKDKRDGGALHTDQLNNTNIVSNNSKLFRFANVTAFNSLLIKFLEELNSKSIVALPIDNILTHTNVDHFDNEIFKDLVKKLLSFGPSQADAEIRLLSPENQYTLPRPQIPEQDGNETNNNLAEIRPLKSFLLFLGLLLKTKNNYDIVQTHLGLLIKYHFQTIVSNVELLELFNEMYVSQNTEWSLLEKQILSCLQLIDTFKIH